MQEISAHEASPVPTARTVGTLPSIFPVCEAGKMWIRKEKKVLMFKETNTMQRMIF